MQDIVNSIVFMAVVFGLAALIVLVLDKITLRSNMSEEEREAAMRKRSNRFQRGWTTAFFIMALVALPLHAFGFDDEPIWERVLYSALAALIVISFLFSWHDARKRKG